MGGHLFIINGDLTKIASDALLVPTDDGSRIEPQWRPLFKGREDEIPKAWGNQRLKALRRVPKEPQIWLGNIGRVGNRSDFSAFAPTVKNFVKKADAALRTVPDEERIYPGRTNDLRSTWWAPDKAAAEARRDISPQVWWRRSLSWRRKMLSTSSWSPTAKSLMPQPREHAGNASVMAKKPGRGRFPQISDRRRNNSLRTPSNPLPVPAC